ncbi:MAG TPA: hypothetical protein VK691_05135 [Solirubrobacteraceae bacterium]|nr:hypothetical protein [Solirubrobacteraceae bacterium]
MSQHETARILFELATAPFILMGGLHALASLIDTLRLTFFAPTKPGLRSEMEVAGIRLREMFPGASGARFSMWRGWLGFNISHGLGAATFGFAMLILSLHDYGLVQQISAIEPFTIAVSAVYFLLAVRFWFYAPAIGCGLGLACFIAAAALS